MAATGVDTEGGTFIPASQRPDGTWRKPRRVKEGYIPQEEVPLYESRGKQWAKSKSSYPVGLDPELIKASELKLAAKTNVVTTKKKKKGINSQPIPNPGAFDDYDSPGQQVTTEKTTSSSTTNVTIKVTTNKKKQQQRQPDISSSSSADKKPNESSTTTTTTIIINEQQSSNGGDPVKRLRNLRKKLRDIEALEKKIKSKELKNPDKDQLEKVSRKANVQAEILALEVELNLSTS